MKKGKQNSTLNTAFHEAHLILLRSVGGLATTKESLTGFATMNTCLVDALSLGLGRLCFRQPHSTSTNQMTKSKLLKLVHIGDPILL